MRLLSTNELETKRRQQEAQTVLRGAKVASLVDNQIKKLNASKDQLEAFKKEQEVYQQKFLDELLQERLKAEHRLKELSEECIVALKPIRLEREALEEQKIIIDERLLLAKRLEHDSEVKLNLAKQKEADAKNKEKKLRVDLEYLENGLKFLDKRDRDIKDREYQLESRTEKFELDCTIQVNNLEEKTKQAKDTIALYEAKSKLLDEDRELLAKEKIRFESDRTALSIAFQEAKKKGII